MKMLIAACSVAFCLQSIAFAQEKEAARPSTFPSLGKGPVQTGGPVIHSQEPSLIQREPKVQPRPPVRGQIIQEQDSGPLGPRAPKLIGAAPSRPDCQGKVAEKDMPGAPGAAPTALIEANSWGVQSLPVEPKGLKRPTIQPQAKPQAMPAAPAPAAGTRAVPSTYNGPLPVPAAGGYFSGFYYNRLLVNQQFFAYRNWGPTQYFYFASAGYWWSPTYGYSWNAPVVNGVITVAIVETITTRVYNPFTRRWTLQTQTALWYYNAYWFPQLNCWVYQDFRGVYHAVRF